MFTGNMNSDVNSNINLQGENLYRVTSFAYLVSTLATDGDLDVDMTSSHDGKSRRMHQEFCVTLQYRIRDYGKASNDTRAM